MTNDPVQLLRKELVVAARRQAQSATAQAQPAASRRGRRSLVRRRPLLIALAALVVAAPATAAVTGALDLGGGTTPDGSTYNVKQYARGADVPGVSRENSDGRVCQQTELRNPDGSFAGRGTECGDPSRVPADKPLDVGFVAAPGHSLIVSGTVSAQVARVQVTGADKPITLEPFTGGRQYFSAISTDSAPTAIAYDKDGREIARFTIPMTK